MGGNKIKIKKLFLTPLLVIFFAGIAKYSLAVLPPDVYKERAKESDIKAIAVVKDIKTTAHNKGVNSKKVTFTLIKSFSGNNVPENFYGHCSSFEPYFWERQKPMVGGTIYHYPKKGSKVFVTVTQNNGLITTYSVLTHEIEQELQNNDLKNIEFSMESIRIKKDF